MYKIAVITRTKDRPIYIRRAIDSVHSQTYKDFIQVIYNDGGDKGKIEDLIETYPEDISKRIILIHGAGSNGKQDTVFNDAINSVKSQYIAIHDDDDSWDINFLKLTIDNLESNNSHGVITRTNKIIEVVKDNGDIIIKQNKEWMPEVKAASLYKQCVDNQTATIRFVYSREAFDSLGGYSKKLGVCGDWEFGIRFLIKYDINYLDPGYPLAYYHQREPSRGASNNSINDNEKFRYYTNMVLNDYLRKDIENGSLGIGYIMNSLRYSQLNIATLAKKMLPKTISDKLKKRVQL